MGVSAQGVGARTGTVTYHGERPYYEPPLGKTIETCEDMDERPEIETDRSVGSESETDYPRFFKLLSPIRVYRRKLTPRHVSGASSDIQGCQQARQRVLQKGIR